MVWVGPGRSCESGSARAWADEGRGITECSHVTAGVLLVRIEPKGWWAGEKLWQVGWRSCQNTSRCDFRSLHLLVKNKNSDLMIQ